MNYSGRILWLSDTFGDRNGVSTVLTAILGEIRMRDLPVDMLVCSNTLRTQDHLIVIKPVSEFTIPLYRNQPLRIPGFFDIRRIFREGNYSRVICSTEGPMGLAALWLKKAFSVKVSFFLHTDWITFASEALSLKETGLGALRRLLRLYYRRYNDIFVLNTDQQKWLTSHEIGLDPSRVFLTAHWADPVFVRESGRADPSWPFNPDYPVVLFAGRLSKEKGIMELPYIYDRIRSVFPEVQMVVAGTGPAGEELKQRMPSAIYTGWVEHDRLPDLFRASDIMVLPSRFDTFSCVALEAMSCGLPVVSYNAKGPKDIITHEVDGFLAETAEEIAGAVIEFFLDARLREDMSEAANIRARFYRPEQIMDRLLSDLGIVTEACYA